MNRVRKWLRILHRDIGFLAIGCSLIFAVSGIALNHIHDWNPNYTVESTTLAFTPSETDDAQLLNQIINQLERSESFKTSYWESPKQLKLFYSDGLTISYLRESGQLVLEKVSKRLVFFQLNQLHLNNIKGNWVYFSDLYAISLIFLALSGLFIIKGRKGIWGRGGILTAVGVIIPFLYLVFF